jgi:murein DD-endopeptidase MepM/ murein hydrolase activator NlpD
MLETLLERISAWVHATFPERQIYIRSDSRVQFFTFGPALQATMATLSLLFLGWVAFTSVNVLFKDRIIQAKNHRFQQMQANYESRIADLQLSYDELNGALVSAQDKFRSVANQVERKQQIFAQLLQQANPLTAASGAAVAAEIPHSSSAGMANDSLIGAPSQGFNVFGGSSGGSELSILPQPAGPTKASFLSTPLENLAGAASDLLRRALKRKAGTAAISTATLRSPGLQALAQQTERLNKLNGADTALLQGLDARISDLVASVQGVMRRVGINPDRIVRVGVGGPSLPFTQVRLDGIEDASFTQAYVDTSAHNKQLGALISALGHVPLTTPVHGAGFELTSDFGPRVDPFTHAVGFHPGLDFGGPWGATVTATAPGTVVFAGPRGGYGNMVEIEHGYGMRTRYGHLSSILVHVGAKVGKGAPVGRLGSTGRSTGPHVHYEVWLADVVRDPSRFIEAGRHVQ